MESKSWDVYQMPEGDWGATASGDVSDGFATEVEALRWVCDRLSASLEILQDAAIERSFYD